MSVSGMPAAKAFSFNAFLTIFAFLIGLIVANKSD